MEQLSLFTFPQSPPPIPQPIHDPYWDEITCDKVDEILLTNDDLDSSTVSPGQFLEKFAHQHSEHKLETDDTQQADSPGKCVGEQVISDTKKTANQHDTPTHWVETYWVERAGNKYWYYRYAWMQGRKIQRQYIGSTSNAHANRKKEAVEIAIADGETPAQIRKMIKEWGNSQQTSETSAAHPKF